ncbi:MAG: hypothetical protein OXI30_14855 [Chloroflexota bacterium]|nr:hypothetical protein [Chloroflexota bacterium]
MTPELLKGFYRIAVFVLGVSIALLVVVKPDSAEFIVTLMSIGIGAALLVAVILTSRYLNR